MKLATSNLFFICLVACTFWQSSAQGHEFDPGHIERSVDVVIRDRSINVRYAIGLSDITIVDWLARENSISKAEEQRLRKLIAEFEAEERADEAEASPVQEADEKAEVDQDDVQPAEFQTELMQRFKDELGPKICENFELDCDGEKLSFTQQLENSARHHVVLEINLTSSIPDDFDSAELLFIDRNFLDVAQPEPAESPETAPEDGKDLAKPNLEQAPKLAEKFLYSGGIRLACRVKGGTVQISSNVAPVVARAKVTDVGPLDTTERVTAATISTKLSFLESQ